MASKKPIPPFPERDALLFDTVQARLFRDDPFARLLLLASVQERLASISDSSRLFAPLPFWSSAETHAQFTQFAAAIGEHFVDHYYHHYRNQGQEFEARERRSFNEHLTPQLRDFSRQIGAWAGEPEAIEAALATGLFSSWGQAVIKLLPQALEHLHRQDLGPEALAERLAAGRAHLAGAHGLSQERLDQLAQDPTLCVALSRLAFFGATDPTAVSFLLFAGFREDHYDTAPVRFVRNHFGRGEGANELHLGTMLNGLAHQYDIGKRMDKAESAARGAFFAMQADQAGFSAFRHALVKACSTSDDPREDRAWASVDPIGDFDLDIVAPYPKEELRLHRRRLRASQDSNALPGRAERFGVAQAILGDIDAIFQWRNPLSTLLGSAAASGASSSSIELALKDAERFELLGASACAHAVAACVHNPSSRKDAASALASALAQGFEGVEGSASSIFAHLLPQENVELPAHVARQRWFADELSRDPLGSVALSVGKLYGVDAPEPLGMVGEAKRALAERGLSNAAWKALAANPQLRQLLTQAAQASSELAQGEKPLARPRPPAAEAARVMSLADKDGSSAKARLGAALAKEQAHFPIQACVNALALGSGMNMDPEEQAQALVLISETPALQALFAGALPALPALGAQLTAGALRDGADALKSLAEDASAARDLGAGFFKAIGSRLRRHGARMGATEARHAVSRDVHDIMDCAKAMPPGFWSRLDAKDPFSHALRIHGEWVETLARTRLDNDPQSGRRWPSLVDHDRMGRASAVELLSGRELFEEGKAMSHCVGSYSQRCHGGQSRIISLRLDGARCSTLELAPCDARGLTLESLDFNEISQRKKVASWRAVQHRGKCNARVTHPDILALAQAIEERATQAFHAGTSRLEEKRKAEVEAKRKVEAAPKTARPARI